MIDASALIQDLRALLGNCGVVEGLDKAVEYRSNTSMREATVEAIDKIVQKVDDSYRRMALIPLLVGIFLVHSRINAMGASNLSVEPDTNIRMGLDHHGDGWMNQIDSGAERFTYYFEFGLRVARLRVEILKGNLDQILGFNPTLILHEISGLSGGLLPALGWDPLKGETYTRFANDPHLKTKRDLDAADERLARKREETSIAAQNLGKTLIPAIINRDTNAQITYDNMEYPLIPYLTHALATYDYRVYPLTPFLEGLSKSGNKLETKPTSEAESAMEKQPTRAEDNNIAEGKIVEGSIIEAAKPDTQGAAINTAAPELIGIVGFTLTEAMATKMGLDKETQGVIVSQVFPSSLAEKAGLRTGTIPAVFNGLAGMLGGDIINGIGDTPLNNREELGNYLSQYHIHGTKIKFNVLRNGKQVDIEIIY